MNGVMSNEEKGEVRKWVLSWFPSSNDLRMNQKIWETMVDSAAEQFANYAEGLLAENKKLNDIVNQVYTVSKYLTKLSEESYNE